MGAGSSTEQQSPEPPPAEDTTPAEPESRGGSPSAEAAPCATEDPAIAAEDPAAKLLQKNGQLSTLNGLAEQGNLNLQEGDLSGQEEAEVILPEVGQRESENVSEKDSAKDMAADSEAVEEVTRQGQEDAPEVIQQVASSESNLEELAPPTEAQSNDVGFKKVFKFVGFKFTVKKDKTEKSDTVQLLTVKKDEGDGTGGSIGAGDHQDPSCESGEATCKESELQQPTEKPEDIQVPEQSDAAPPPPEAECGQAAEEAKEQGEEKQEKDASKSPESPTSPVASETASPFRKFFTQGWAGWRKKTSFRKPKEEEADAAEKRKEQEPERSEAEGSGLSPGGPEERPVASEPAPASSTEEARLSAEYEKVELPVDEQVDGAVGERAAPLATEVFDDKEEGPQEVVAEVQVGPAAAQQSGQPEPPEAAEPPPAPDAGPQPAAPAQEPAMGTQVCAPDGDQPPPAPEPSPEDKAPSKPPEGVLSEADVLASQEKAKAQGSPLKKLFSSTGLKKLSGKKQKGKRGGDEEAGDQSQAAAESPDSTDEQRGESSASSPEEPEEVIRVDKGTAEGPQEGDAEEGAASDGEKRREGVTPWASFKKMVTPKKRVRRPSESDKEDELDKVKSATLSSTESAASELQEEVRGSGDEPKVEEPKRKVDTSVSWEALICVGSSKKRARKASSSDEEGAPRTTGGDGQKADEAGKEAGSEAILAGSQERDQAAGSSSPEAAGSPTEGEGVSTWESFKRLVTARKKSKSKLEEKNEDSALEQSASDVEPGKEESWVSIKKFIPGRRKKRPDGKHEQATAEDAGPAAASAEDDPDVPAVVPLSEYDAVEREKMEAQTSPAEAEAEAEPGKSLVHTVAATSVEERSPSWISTSVTGPLELAEEEAAAPTAEGLETKVTKEEGPEAPKAVPESPAAHDDTVVSTKELTPGAMEATEMPAAEEATEASGAEETTEMVSAVSQLTDSPDTTEEATPVQEVEGVALDVEDQQRRTHAVLQAAAEKVREESGLRDTSVPQDTVLALPKVASTILEKVEEAEEDSAEVELKTEVCVEPEGHTQETEELTVQTTPKSFEEGPQVTESGGSTEPLSTCQAEAIAEEKLQEIAMEQAVPRDCPETFTDSETDGSTPVAEPEAPDATGQVHVMELPKVTPGTQLEVAEAEAGPVQEERPSTPPTLESQEENTEAEEVAEHSEEKISVETVPVQSWTEVTQDVSQFADEIKDKGGEVPAETDIAAGQEKTPEVAVQEEIIKGAGCPKDDDSHLWAHAQSLPSTEEREMEVEVGSEKSGVKATQVSEARPAECSKQLVQAGDVTVTDREKEVSLGESTSCLEQEEAECVEVQVQSSEASLPLVAAAVEEKVVEETIKVLETGETLVSAGARLVLEEKSSGQDDLMTEPGEGAVSTAPEPQTGSMTVTGGAAAEDDVSSEPEGDKTASQKWTSEEDGQQVAREDVKLSVPREEEMKAENEILELETESSKLVQNVIQTAVDQFIHTEDTAAETPAAHLQAQVHLTTAISQATGQKPEKEDHDSQVCTQEEALVLEATEETELTLGGQVPEEPSRESNEVSETILAGEVENSSVSGQQLEEVILASKEEEGSIVAPSVPGGDGCAVLTERTEESQLEPKEVEKSDAVEDPENQISALALEDATGDLTKESLDTNGPKLKETQDAPQVGDQEGGAHSDSDQEIETQRQETQKPQSKPAKPELAESQDAV
ncbi:A-kinase anchor protein 12 [Ochotona princeps]|uniref:A-kinase anchor protein 12 n=1 Tax=Ochotona princeps TaxID=9978 RepID=UPI0027144EB3|nr:A-kinase anchor protein 12 [Ochotona princeps]